MTIAEALRWAVTRLEATSDNPRLDAEVLLGFALEVGRTHLYTWPDRLVDQCALGRLHRLVDQRAEGIPVAYLTGRQEFWSLPLEVSPATLIPRPETELLVELALARLPADAPATVLDLGTGTGAIALAVASERPACAVTAVDSSADALAIARRNSERLGIAIELVAGDWYAPLAGRRFALIVANPPYIGSDEPEPNLGDSRFEPRSALIAAEAGLAALRHIITQAPSHLAPHGWLLVEHGYRQGAACRDLFHAAGFAGVETMRDLQGHERVTLGRWPA